MGFKDFIKRGSGLDLVTEGGDEDKEEEKPTGVGKEVKKSDAISNGISRTDAKMLKQLEGDLSKAIEKLEDARDKLRVRRGY